MAMLGVLVKSLVHCVIVTRSGWTLEAIVTVWFTANHRNYRRLECGTGGILACLFCPSEYSVMHYQYHITVSGNVRPLKILNTFQSLKHETLNHKRGGIKTSFGSHTYCVSGSHFEIKSLFSNLHLKKITVANTHFKQTLKHF